MLCKIAELVAEVPASGGLAPRCRDYLYTGDSPADIIIREEDYHPETYGNRLTPEMLAYVESCRQFCVTLLRHSGFYLHASAVAKDGKAYLFSAPSGTGKSTHTRLWQQEFGPDTVVFNDDKPVLRLMDGVWYAYGTPWCGKDGINRNMKAPVAGICFLKQGSENRIRRVSVQEGLQKILTQTVWQRLPLEQLDLLLSYLDHLLTNIPVFELENRPEPEAARLSYTTMRQAAEEMGL